MDRKLTDKEKVRQSKKYGSQNRRSSGTVRVSYSALIKWFLFALFLTMPLLVKRLTDLLDVSIPVNGPSVAAISSGSSNEAVIRVYAARTWGSKGIFAVHSWIAMKRQNSDDFEVIQVIGWKQEYNGNVLFRETNVPIDSWWGNEATLLLDLQGDDAEAIIDKVDAVVEEYPWRNEYTLYPGPNSNTFVAWVGLQVPEMGLDLPSTAIGKDWRPLEQSLGHSASGTGFQASLLGLLGTSIGVEEGLEVNVLGLSFELDVFDFAIEVPLFGRYHLWYLLCYLVIWSAAARWIKRGKSKYLQLI